jgi:hypothetical protein
MRKRTPIRMLLAAVPVAATALLFAPAPAQAASCYFFSSEDVGVTVKGHKCDNANGTYKILDGYVEDTKADGKCARYGIDWFSASGLAKGNDNAKACGKGTRTNIGSWSTPSGANHGNDYFYAF